MTTLTKNIEPRNQYSRFDPKIFTLVLLLFSIIMLFAGLTSAYIVRKMEGNWLMFELPQTFLYSTLVLIVSSIPLLATLKNSKTELNTRKQLLGVFSSFLLGVLFCILQLKGWSEMVEQGLFFSATGDKISASFDYVLSGVHLAHVVGGLMFLLIVGILLIFKKLKTHRPLKLVNIYWHFLGILWIYLYLFMYFSRS